VKEILLTRGIVALVDDADYENLTQFKWCADHGYAMRKPFGPRGPSEYMHRRVLGLPISGGYRTGPYVDHINGLRHDNRRYNLRLASRQQNCRNRGPDGDGSSRFKGVTRVRTGQWKAQIGCNGVKYYLGQFATEEAAAKAYNDAAERFDAQFFWKNAV